MSPLAMDIIHEQRESLQLTVANLQLKQSITTDSLMSPFGGGCIKKGAYLFRA